jgi:hypothetical protein
MSASLRQMWAAIRELPYPHGRPEVELGSVDFSDLIELDSSIAGYVSRIAAGEALNSSDRRSLAHASLQVRAMLPELSGETRAYFERVAELTEGAVSALSAEEQGAA